MKKNCYFIFAALMLITAACAQEELPVPGEDSNTETSGFVYIEAVSELTGETKSSVDADDGDFKWSTGDKVAVYAAGGYQISEGLTADFDAKSSATFAFAGDFGQGDRVNFAVFPSDLACDEFGDVYTGEQVTAEGLLINLPATYNLSAVKGTMAPTPMIATNASGKNLDFKSICALVKFTLHSIPMQTQYITFDFNGKKVRGEFVIKNVVPGEEATKVVATDTEEFDDVITVYNDKVFTTFQKDLIVNIPIPAGEYSKVTITTWDGDPWDGGHKINGITSSIRTAVAEDGKSYLSWNAGRLSSGKREIFMPVFTVDSNPYPGSGTRVVFAPGNLTAEIVTNPTSKSIVGTAANWSFAENQYDAIMNIDADNGNSFAKGSEGKKIDLFAWIGNKATNNYTENELYGILYPSNSGLSAELKDWNIWIGIDADGIIKSDWGNLEICGGQDLLGNPSDTYPANTWRLPDRNTGTSEWSRLLTARKVNNVVKPYSYVKAEIKDGETLVANGLIIFPDEYATPEVPIGMPTFTKCNTATSEYSLNSISLADWAALESVGCVFLPAANNRYSNSGLKIDRPGDGLYWTNYAWNYKSGVENPQNNSIALIFSDISVSQSVRGKTDLQPAASHARANGASVRLVRQIN